MKKYKLTLKCGNCNKSWRQEIPFGYEWQDFGYFRVAGYGKRCWNYGHLDCKETVKFHEVNCKNCGSKKVVQKI